MNASSAEAVAELLRAGADLGARDIYGRDALDWALRNGHAEAAGALIAAGLSVHGAEGRPPRLVESIGLVADPESISLLIRAGADPNSPDGDGLTPLMRAAAMGQPGCVRVLLAAGADPGRRDRRGRSALDLALELEDSLPDAQPDRSEDRAQGRARWEEMVLNVRRTIEMLQP